MLATVNSFLETLTITIGTFLIERYVLLEPPMEAKKQRLFYIISFALIVVVFFVAPDIAQGVILISGGLNIFLGRKKHRVLGCLMVIPLIGLMNGVASPLFIVRILLREIVKTNNMATTIEWGTLSVYFVFALLLLLFYMNGKKWRRWFGENMKDRSLSRSEYAVICISGLVITVFSTYSDGVLSRIDEYSPDIQRTLSVMMIFFFSMSFLTTLTIIVLVMQGNSRKFYHDKVTGMWFSIIATMADMVENRDPNTGGHIKRTAKYVEIIGKRLLRRNEFSGILTQQYLDDMVVAAPLHDIGKISVPDAILNKPGRLTDEEFEIMKLHASVGGDILKNAQKQLGDFDYLKIAMDMAQYHHEWFNGKGYPNGIKDNDIPLCARIMAVADVFDALTSKRCYKEAMPVEKAYDIIADETGTHFDPIIAKAFLDSRNEIAEAMNELSDDGQ